MSIAVKPRRCYRVRALALLGRVAAILPATAVVLTIVILTTALPAFAALGADASSVQADQAHMQGSLRTTQAEAYTLQEIRAANGTVVREYVSPSGKVFAVAWQGPWPPDMRQLLGTYFAPYQQALQSQASQSQASQSQTSQSQANSRAGRRPLLIQQSGLVVQSGGHMRSFAGRAYIPQMLPQGVSAEEIR